jgi:hypothetical protein
MSNRDQVRASQRRYLLQVVVWLLVSGLASPVLVGAINGLTGGQPQVMGIVGIAVMLVIVGGAFALHRRNVRCPACSAWLVPVGVNGFAPSTCPKCKADLRS